MKMEKFCKITTFVLAVLICSGFHLYAETEEAMDPEITETETGFYYTVQKGDTLWDLSERFNDSPWTWPGLWNNNSEIPNPHWIYPGQKIRLYLRKDVGAKKINEVIKPVEEKPVVPVAGIRKDKPVPTYYYPSIERLGFIRKEAVPSLGYILKQKANHTYISERDVVYIIPSSPESLAIGSKYRICEISDKVKGKNGKGTIGLQHYITGIVEVTAMDENVATGIISENYTEIQETDFLIPLNNESDEISLIPNSDLEGLILKNEQSSLYSGNGDIMFIDKGEIEGVFVGQIYSLYTHFQEKDKNRKKDKNLVLLPKENYARFLVLHTELNTSTVLILDTLKDIEPFAMFHAY